MTNDQTVAAAVGIALTYGLAAWVGSRDGWLSRSVGILLILGATIAYAYLLGVLP